VIGVGENLRHDEERGREHEPDAQRKTKAEIPRKSDSPEGSFERIEPGVIEDGCSMIAGGSRAFSPFDEELEKRLFLELV